MLKLEHIPTNFHNIQISQILIWMWKKHFWNDEA
jgi:hypothetical protein